MRSEIHDVGRKKDDESTSYLIYNSYPYIYINSNRGEREREIERALQFDAPLYKLNI